MPGHNIPYFPLYASDFLNDQNVRTLSNSQVGLYIRILCAMWQDNNCRLPANTKKLYQAIGGLPRGDCHWQATLAELLNCGVLFVSNGFVYNARLLAEWRKASLKSESASNAANVKIMKMRTRRELEENSKRIQREFNSSQVIENKESSSSERSANGQPTYSYTAPIMSNSSIHTVAVQSFESVKKNARPAADGSNGDHRLPYTERVEVLNEQTFQTSASRVDAGRRAILFNPEKQTAKTQPEEIWQEGAMNPLDDL